jgi:hypothetical protein
MFPAAIDANLSRMASIALAADLANLEGLACPADPAGLASDPATMRLIQAFGHAFEATHEDLAELRRLRSRAGLPGGEADHDGVADPEYVTMMAGTDDGWWWAGENLDPGPSSGSDLEQFNEIYS